ncbi:MAG: DedA family protein [Alphaproteobacteria bacterium]|nr:DedA family protein [Alphaproteobacteria bacterium]
MRSLYDWTMGLASGERAVWALCVVAFVESSFFPIPPDLLLIPLILSDRTKAFRIAAYATLASVLGGYLGYGIGYFAYAAIEPYLSAGFIDKVDWFRGQYNTYGAWVVFMAGITPFPYKIITIASGVTHLDLAVFTVASVLARGARFFLIAGLLWKWGAPMKVWIEKNLGWLSVVFFLLLIGGFLLVKLI